MFLVIMVVSLASLDPTRLKNVTVTRYVVPGVSKVPVYILTSTPRLICPNNTSGDDCKLYSTLYIGSGTVITGTKSGTARVYKN